MINWDKTYKKTVKDLAKLQLSFKDGILTEEQETEFFKLHGLLIALNIAHKIAMVGDK